MKAPEIKPSVEGSVLNVWKTINLGAVKYHSGVLNTFDPQKDGPWLVCDPCASSMLYCEQFMVFGNEWKIDLVKISLEELGFDGVAFFDQILQRAKEKGLKICPAEVGPSLRLEYQDQPDGESLHIGMESMIDFEGTNNHFLVERSGRCLVLCSGARIRRHWLPKDIWVFVLPRPKETRWNRWKPGNESTLVYWG